MRYEVLTQYGEFTKESDGRISGHVLFVGGMRQLRNAYALTLWTGSPWAGLRHIAHCLKLAVSRG